MNLHPLLGDTFLCPNSANDKWHLNIVISRPFGDPPSVLLVPVTTIRGIHGEDRTCELDRGDHEFVDHPSCVVFRFTQKIEVSLIEAGCKAEPALMKRHKPMSGKVLRRVIAGAYNSQFMKLALRDILIQQGIEERPIT